MGAFPCPTLHDAALVEVTTSTYRKAIGRPTPNSQIYDLQSSDVAKLFDGEEQRARLDQGKESKTHASDGPDLGDANDMLFWA
jgi:hypothetical protein